MFIYITYDGDGYITDFKTVVTNGYVKTFLIDHWIADFMKFSTKFRYDGEQLLNPGNLPTEMITDLEQSVTDLKESSKQTEQAATTLATGQTDLKTGLAQVQQAVTDLAIQQATNATGKQN